MGAIPSKCPKCGTITEWKEVVNPFTTGIPVGNGAVRIKFLSIRGIFAESIKKKLGFYKVTYCCRNCGYEDTYELDG